MTAELLEGKHRIAYRLTGHKPHDYSLLVEAGRPQELPRVELRPVDGTIALSSTPAGAAVTVDGTYRGETPLDLALPPGRDHAIRVSKPGHESASRQLRVGSGERRAISMELEVIEGEVEIAATPADAELLINGEARGRAVASLRLPAIAHEIEIRKEGYVTYQTTITPRPGFPQAIRVALETIEQARALPVRVESPQEQGLILIQGGRFEMGAPRREPGRRANESLREVSLTRSFYISAQVVTNAEFDRFRLTHESGVAGSFSLDADDYPVVQVTWEEAARYCNWLSKQASLPPAYAESDGVVIAVRPLTGGYRLPSEAEWAWVARYDDGPQPEKYPWGDALPVAPGSGNYADGSADELLARVIPNYDDSFPATAPVGSFQPNAFGLYNIGGNVAEWVHDIYAIYPSGASTVAIDPRGPDEGELHVIRGSSWMDSSISELRLTYRDYGKKARPDVGFRIARYAE
jgi:formylglycine-generating enzyme required for sulfatase activity